MNNKIMISASIMCADQLNLCQDITKLINAQTDYLHLDIMDGHFVDNLTLGLDCCRQIAKFGHSRDVHLLVEQPANYIERLELCSLDILQVHYESCANIEMISEVVHEKQAKFGLVLNPESPIEILTNYLPFIDVVTLMMIRPGFAGRPLEKGMIEKIAALKNFLLSLGYENIIIEVDGNVNVKNVPQMFKNGARIFVAGTSSVFRKDITVEMGIASLRECIQKEGE